MTSARVSRLHRALTAALVTTYVASGVAGLFVDAVDQKALWVVFLCGGAASILVGMFVRRLPASLSLSLALISVGAMAGALPLVWTFVVPVAAVVLVALSFSLSRRARIA